MQSNKSVTQESALISTLRVITQAYQEISVLRMQRLRTDVVKTRDFIEELAEIFYEVKSSYKKHINELEKQQTKQNKTNQINTPHSRQGRKDKVIAVYLAPNSKLYGKSPREVFHKFMEYIEKNDCDIMLVGKLGVEFFKEAGIHKDYIYYEIPENNITLDDLRALIFQVTEYQTINVFYGKFESIATQTPTYVNITGDLPLDKEKEEYIKNHSFLFEPSLIEILKYFQDQIFLSLLKQSVHESHLANSASRINSMEQAIQNIDSKNKKLIMIQRKLKHQLSNKKQLERLSGRQLWGNE